MLRVGLSRGCGPVVAGLVALFAWSATAAQEQAVANELPRSWRLKDIAKKAPPYGAEGQVYVLAWKVIEDERPLRVESCLVLTVLNEPSEQGRWCLAHLYRHPADKKPEWRLSFTHVTGEPGTKYFPGLELMHAKQFQRKPGNKELYAARGFEELNWTFELEKAWRFVGCGICERTWQQATGERPTRFFGN